MNIKKIIITGTLLVSMVAFSQKDELKTLKKLTSKDTPNLADLTAYKEALTKLQPVTTEEADKVYYSYYKAKLPQFEMVATGAATNQMQMQKLFNSNAIAEMASGYKAMLEYEKKSGKKVFTDDINKDIAVISPILVNMAMTLGNAKKDKEAATIFYDLYQ